MQDLYFNYGVPLGVLHGYYLDWVKDDYYNVLSCTKESKTTYYCALMSKRGNRAYVSRVRKRFKPFWDFCSENRGLTFNRGNGLLGKFAWVTLTYDPSLCGLNEAWGNIGKNVNKFLSSVKQKYGKISIVRCYECFSSMAYGGKAFRYPHVHLLIYLHDTKINCWINRKGEVLFTNSFKNSVSVMWHSHVKIVPAKSLGAVGYMLKYITKSYYEFKNLESVFVTWLFGVRCYSVSKDFLSILQGLGILPTRPILRNSNMAEGDVAGEWRFTGLNFRSYVKLALIWFEVPLIDPSDCQLHDYLRGVFIGDIDV